MLTTPFHHSTDTETGPGVYETALAYTDALRMADNAMLFKFLAKSIGMKHGVVPSFMAKPWGNVSQDSSHLTHCRSYIVTSSCRVVAGTCRRCRRFREVVLISRRHIHVSLRDANGRSLFAVSDAELEVGRANAQYSDTKFLSQEGEWFLAGILDGLPDGKPSWDAMKLSVP